jgi:hypothetical protein
MRRLQETIHVCSSPRAVWQVLADFGGVAKWAPGIRRARLEIGAGEGVGTRRFLHHAWGFRIAETVTRWDEGEGYAFELTRPPFPMRDVLESWKIEETDGQALVTTSVSYGMRLGLLGTVFDGILVRFLVARAMREGVRGLKRYVERLPNP